MHKFNTFYYHQLLKDKYLAKLSLRRIIAFILYKSILWVCPNI